MELLRTITAHYLVFVFLSSLGVLQLAGARSGTDYILLVPSRRLAAVLGIVLTLAGFVFFFTQATYYFPGLEGTQLFSEFGAAALFALLFSAGVSSLRRGCAGQAVPAMRNRLRAGWNELMNLDSGGSRRSGMTQ